VARREVGSIGIAPKSVKPLGKLRGLENPLTDFSSGV